MRLWKPVSINRILRCPYSKKHSVWINGMKLYQLIGVHTFKKTAKLVYIFYCDDIGVVEFYWLSTPQAVRLYLVVRSGRSAALEYYCPRAWLPEACFYSNQAFLHVH
ncbi:unnamed protein product [Ixodes pacificus]